MKDWVKIGNFEYEYDKNGLTGRVRNSPVVMLEDQAVIWTATLTKEEASYERVLFHINNQKLQKHIDESGWNPVFYVTGDFEMDSYLINKPHIEKQGKKEDRTSLTLELLHTCKSFRSFNANDALNLQNAFLKENNWGGVKAGWRKNTAAVFSTETGQRHNYPTPKEVVPLVDMIFPVKVGDKEHLLDWYKKFGVIHPFTDLNGRVSGIIVSVLYYNYLKQKNG